MDIICFITYICKNYNSNIVWSINGNYDDAKPLEKNSFIKKIDELL